MTYFFSNERDENNTGTYGVLSCEIHPEKIDDNIIERGAALCKLGSSMPSPVARLFLFSSAMREVNAIEAAHPRLGHKGKLDQNGTLVQTPYHDLVGELLDMLEFVFQYGDDPDFHVVRWDVNVECEALKQSRQKAHQNLAASLEAAFGFGLLSGQPVYLFLWNDAVIGGTSPISIVYTSANLRAVMMDEKLEFVGEAGNSLFKDEVYPLHQRSRAFREYLYRLRLTDMMGVNPGTALYEMAKYIEDSGNTYDTGLYNQVKVNPSAFTNIKNLTTQGNNVRVAGVQLRVSDHSIHITNDTCGYILEPTSKIYQHGDTQAKVPLVLIDQGCDGLKYVGREWIVGKDKIDTILSDNLADRDLPGFKNTKYPYLTVRDLLEEHIIEVSYKINSERFFTGSREAVSYLLPLKPLFFEYFKVSDLIRDGKSTGMLTMDCDNDRERVIVELHLPLVNGNTICLHKQYDTRKGSEDKIDCYDGAETFDLALFPSYRLEPSTSNNVYNLMVGFTIDNIELDFFEPQGDTMTQVAADKNTRSVKGSNGSSISTNHIHVNGAFSYAELSVELSNGTDTEGRKKGNAMIVPVFQKVDSDPTHATNQMSFSIDFGTTNTHVSCACVPNGKIAAKNDVEPFAYSENDSQMAMFNSRDGVVEFGAFSTAVKREFVPVSLGNDMKFPMRTATYQLAGRPVRLVMFENTNIGFNYGADLAKSKNYHTNIKWDRFDPLAEQRIATYFEQMLWMMKNKSVQNDCSDAFNVVVTYPISMREKDFVDFTNAWETAKEKVHCNANICYRTESVAPYYSYLENLYGDSYVNIDIGGGTTDILYYNPFSKEAHVFSAFFAANDLWGDGTDEAVKSSKANGFVTYYRRKVVPHLGDAKTNIEDVYSNADSSADIISYLFANDELTQFSSNIRHSSKMPQLLAIHFSALMFYTGYALYLAEAEVPKHISFTGMGSKYIKLISSSDADIARIINAAFHYVGEEMKSETLKKACVDVTFAPDPKKVTSEGALISLGSKIKINPSQDIYYGYKDEDTSRTLRYQDITEDVENGVLEVYRIFLKMFDYVEMNEVFGDIGCDIESSVIKRLGDLAMASMREMKDMTKNGQNMNAKLKEPMFFWPLKNPLYIVGKEIARTVINNQDNEQR